MKSFLVGIVLGLFAFKCISSLYVKVLKPQSTKTGPERALLVAPGAYIKGEAYEPLGLQIRETCDFQLWVVLLLDFFDNIVNPLQLGEAVNKAIQSLKDEGFTDGSPVFLAGHSLGGTMVAMHGKNHYKDLSGVLLYAAYLTKGNKLSDYPVPVLTLSGDLDGLTRITRIMDTFQELYEDVSSNMKAKYRTPVLVMEGVNHGQFASGKMPSNVAEHDLPPDVTNVTAYQKIARYTCSFISNIASSSALSQQVLDEGFNTTFRLLEPLARVKALETNGFSHWTELAQKYIIELQNKTQISVRGIEENGQMIKFEFLFPKAEVHNSAVAITTYSLVTYPLDPFDVTLNPLSPIQIQAKMLSQERAKHVLPNGRYGAGNITCKDINQLSILEAFQNSSDVARERFSKRGRQIYLDEDQIVESSVQWQATQLRLSDGSDGLHVSSIKYKLPFDPIQESKSGLFYCALLSPFRAMEWIYVDSMRLKS
ncbi:uncharacterized protein LOC133191597 [Saccostrea echinata]|uniref:uncharacterized protein LOC133191597 n=1 Tax=Saccostrea echinata TaxID=191078 RepID=UPI002A82D4D4|nr:uncharacterized protein LOC133191597 [Saccostrea echinata]